MRLHEAVRVGSWVNLIGVFTRRGRGSRDLRAQERPREDPARRWPSAAEDRGLWRIQPCWCLLSNSQPLELQGNKSQLFEPRAGRCSVRQLERTHQCFCKAPPESLVSSQNRDTRHEAKPFPLRLQTELDAETGVASERAHACSDPNVKTCQLTWGFCFSLCVYSYTLSTSFYPTMSQISSLSKNRPHSSAWSLVHTPRQVRKGAFQMMKGIRLGQTRNIYSCWWNSVPSHSIWNFKQVESPDVARLQPVPGYSIYFYFYIKKNQRATYIQTIE